jgi:hypothetical protein
MKFSNVQQFVFLVLIMFVCALSARAPMLLTTVTGADAITASTTPCITSYDDRHLFLLTPVATNTTNVTLNVCGVAAKPLLTQAGAQIGVGLLQQGVPYLVKRNAANDQFRLIGDIPPSPVETFLSIRIAAGSPYTLTNVATKQKIFNASINGRVSLAVGTWRMSCSLLITAMSATSGNAAFDVIGTGTMTGYTTSYRITGSDAAIATIATPSILAVTTSQSPNPMVTAATATELTADISGIVTVTTTGTVQPSITLNTASAAIVQPGSFCNFHRVSPEIGNTIGTWQ